MIAAPNVVFFCRKSKYIRIALNATSTRIAITKIVKPLTEEFFSSGPFCLIKASFLFDYEMTEAASSTA